MENRREFIKSVLLGGAAMVAAPQILWGRAKTDAWRQVPDILRRIKPPVFPKRDFPVTNYGAAGDGVTDCTDALPKVWVPISVARL